MLKNLFTLVILVLFQFQIVILPTFAQESPEGDFYISGDASRITLELKGVDIIDVLKVLSKKSGLNIIAGKNVRGQVTLFLQDVNVMEALKVILETSELAFEEENGIIKVITQRDYEAVYGRPYEDRRVSELIRLRYAEAQTVSEFVNEIRSAIGKVIVDNRSNSILIMDIPDKVREIKNAILGIDQVVNTKIFELKYSDVEELEAQITEMLTPASGAVKVDKRSNKIVVSDFPENIARIEQMIAAFDVKPRQVLIEAKIVEVTLNDDYAFGIDWDLIFEKANGDDGLVVDTNSFGGLSNFGTGPLSTNSFTTFTINSTGDDFNAVVSLLEGMGKTNTLSSPRLTVLNGEEATLSVATRQPYVSQTVVQGDTTSTTADNIEFVDVGVILTVTPKISEDLKVLLKVKPEISSLAANSPFVISQFDNNGNVVGTRASVPIVTTQEVETTVLVASGKTLVIGGLIQDTESKISRKVPLLGDIPILGKGFRHETVDYSKSELVLFLSPVIMDFYQDSDKEYKQYLNEKGRMKDFNEVGSDDYDYSVSQKRSILPFNNHQKPFWEKREEEMNKELKGVFDGFGKPFQEKQRKEFFGEKITRQYEQNELDFTNQKVPVSPIPSLVTQQATDIKPVNKSDLAKTMYESLVSELINQQVKKTPVLRKYSGESAKLLINVYRDGRVDNVGFPKAGSFEKNEVRTGLREAIAKVQPFSVIPEDIKGDRVTLTVPVYL